MGNLTDLASFVFLDVETTGLPGIKAPKITEISMIACSKDHLLHTKHGELPRVMHKQSFCLNPQRIIHPKASETTGLYNDLLEHESTFDENTAQLIQLFLQRLQTPICLVAHNGNRFDFIIIKRELDALNMRLADHIYCVDSLTIFRKLEEQRYKNDAIKNYHIHVNDLPKKTPIQSNVNPVENQNKTQDLFKGEFDELELTVLDALEHLEKSCKEMSEMQKLNETTPHRNVTLNESQKLAIRRNNNISPSTPQVTPEVQKAQKTPRSRRQLFPPVSSEVSADKSSGSAPKRFRLNDIHERCFGEAIKQAHYAENDVLALLRCAIAEGEGFVAMAQLNSVKFNTFREKF